MGTSIGQIPSTLIAARREPPAVQGVSRNDRPAFDVAAQNDTNAAAGSQNRPADANTAAVSAPAAALVTIGRSVSAARDTIPTLDEIRAQFQAGRVEQAAVAARSAETESARGGESRPEGVPATDRLTFNRFNEAREFSEIEDAGPVQLASARAPEAPELASAEQPAESEVPAPESGEPTSAPEDVQRRRLNLTA